MPNHCTVITFTLVKFLLSLAAFTEVLIIVYTHEKFTQVSKLCYRSKKLKCKHGIRGPMGLSFPAHIICLTSKKQHYLKPSQQIVLLDEFALFLSSASARNTQNSLRRIYTFKDNI